MVRSIVGASLRFRLVVVALAGALVVIGASQLRGAPVDVLPEFAPPTIEVQTEALGLSATEVEDLVTTNLEELLNGTPHLEAIRSKSVPGLSSITMLFEPGTDVVRARQLVSERLTLAFALPNVASPPQIIQPRSATNRVMMVAFSSKSVSPIRMGVFARWDIRPALLSVPGVANVAIWGQQERQLQVRVSPRRLAARHVTLDQIIRTAGNAMWVSPLTFLEASTPGTGGWVDTPQQRLEVRHVFPISTASDLAKVRVEDASMKLGDVANVVESHQPLIGNAIVRDEPTLLFVIEKFPGANTRQVTHDLEQKLDELRPGLHGMELDSRVFRPASYIDRSLDNLTRSLLLGAFLIVVALASLLYSWRAALVSAIAIPVSLLAALLVLDARGDTINTMVLAGLLIALGVVVDDAVVDVEVLARRLREERTTKSAVTVVLESSLELRRVALYGAVIVVVPLLPVFFVHGVSGAFFEPLALSYALAVLTSTVVALTLTPALSLVLLGRSPGRRESPLLPPLRRTYARALRFVLRRPSPAFVACGLVFAAGVAVIPFLGQTLLPKFKDQNVTVSWNGPPGMSQPEMTRLTTRALHELRAIPGVAEAGAHAGRAILGDQVVDVNSGELWATIDPNADYDSTVAAIQRTVDGYPGVQHEVQTYLGSRVANVVSRGASDPIVVRVFGPNLDTLHATADRVRRAVARVDGVSALHMERTIDQPQVQIQVDISKADRYGLKPGDVRREASTLLAGLDVGSLFQQQKVFQVIVWTNPSTRASVTSIEDLLIDTPGGGHVRLGDVATVGIVPSPSLIQHETVSRRIDIGLDISGRDMGSVVGDVQDRLKNVAFPLEYHAEVLGEYQERQAAQRRGAAAGVAAAVLVFLVLQAVFQSWRLAAFSFLTLPVALAGGTLAAFLAGNDISLASLVGFLAVLGIAARNGILLVTHLRQAEQQEGARCGPDLVMRAAGERLPAIVATALTTGLALVPLVVFGTIPGQEIARPIALVVLGGIVTSAALNLFVVPALYLRLHGLLVPAEKPSAAVAIPGGVPDATQ